MDTQISNPSSRLSVPSIYEPPPLEASLCTTPAPHPHWHWPFQTHRGSSPSQEADTDSRVDREDNVGPSGREDDLAHYVLNRDCDDGFYLSDGYLSDSRTMTIMGMTMIPRFGLLH